MSEETTEIESYDDLRAKLKALEQEMAKRAWGSSTGGGGVSFGAGDAQAECESIYQALREERLTKHQEARLREIRLGPMWARIAADMTNGVA